jgi:hypothetical protein
MKKPKKIKFKPANPLMAALKRMSRPRPLIAWAEMKDGSIIKLGQVTSIERTCRGVLTETGAPVDYHEQQVSDGQNITSTFSLSFPITFKAKFS